MARKYLGAAASLAAHLVDKTYSDVSRNEGGIWMVTAGIHATGSGMVTMPWEIPYNMQITRLAYYVGTAGAGGSPTVELQKLSAGTLPSSGATALTGSSGTPGTSPTALTGLTISLSAGDLVWPYIRAINTTTVAIGLQIAWRGVRT